MSCVEMYTGSRYRAVVIPELQPGLLCSPRLKEHQGPLNPLSFFFLPLAIVQKEKEN